MQLKPGQAVGPYELVRKVGEGPASVVWLATVVEQAEVSAGLSWKREVALKLVAASGDEVVDEMAQEWFLTNAAEHHNVVRVYGVGRHEGLLWMAIEYVRGKTWTDLIELSQNALAPLPRSCIVDLVTGAARGLGAAHAATLGGTRGIVHLDIKPPNLMLDPEGVVKVLDFGISRGGTQSAEEVDGFVRGTAPYMAPEQHGGATILGPSTDWFALGAVLYELLVAERLYALPDDWTRRHVQDLAGNKADRDYLLRKLDEADAEIGPFRGILLRMLDPEPSRRYQTADEVERALARLDLPRFNGLNLHEAYRIAFDKPSFEPDTEPDPEWRDFRSAVEAWRNYELPQAIREPPVALRTLFDRQRQRGFADAKTEAFIRPTADAVANADDVAVPKLPASLAGVFDRYRSETGGPITLSEAPSPLADTPTSLDEAPTVSPPRPRRRMARPKRERTARMPATTPPPEDWQRPGTIPFDQPMPQFEAPVEQVPPPEPDTRWAFDGDPEPMPEPTSPVSDETLDMRAPPAVSIVPAELPASPAPPSGAPRWLVLTGISLLSLAFGGVVAWALFGPSSPEDPTPTPAPTTTPALVATPTPTAPPDDVVVDDTDAVAEATPTPTEDAADDGALDCFKDADRDGFGASSARVVCGAGSSRKSGDCNDQNSKIHPEADEIAANGVDENCDDQDLCYADRDGDGFGGATRSGPMGCGGPGLTTKGGDCDDSSAAAAPNVSGETCGDGLDNDCNGSTDESCPVATTVRPKHTVPYLTSQKDYETVLQFVLSKPGCEVQSVRNQATGKRATPARSGDTWTIAVRELATKQQYTRKGMPYEVTWCCPGSGIPRDCATQDYALPWGG